MQTPPDGFILHDRKSPVTDAWAPLWSRRAPGNIEIGFFVQTAHCNARGLLHGGVLAALADNAMGMSLGRTVVQADATTQRPNILTTSLSLDYIASAKPGQWVCITPRVLKASGSSGVVDALITSDGQTIARANASFRIKREDIP
ncbi:MAG: PaaI family thioesterase [Caulobacterales bacterium]|jgi:uncharacterized protein (TIGR00369 family)